MTLVPFKIYPHLLVFFFKEFEGVSRKYCGKQCKAIQIDRTSSIGKYILSNLKKIDYPIKDISSLNNKNSIIKHSIYKRENFSNSFVELPEEYIHDINEMMDTIFRTSFFYYISGMVRNNESKIIHAISAFIEDYELYEYEYLSEEALKRLYYRMKKEGALTRFQDQDMSKSKYRIS